LVPSVLAAPVGRRPMDGGSGFMPQDVFTPSVPAVQNFVDRPDLMRAIDGAFRTPGKQIVLYGETGVGKTSAAIYALFVKKKRPYVRVQCQPAYSTTDLVKSILEEMERVLRVRTCDSGIGYIPEETVRQVPPGFIGDPTPKALVEACGRLRVTVIIDDYEKARDRIVKRELANLAKEFSDRAAELPGRLLIVGIHESPGLMIRLDESLNRRLAQIPVSLLSDAEIRSIFVEGFRSLGIACAPRIVEELISLSGGYGGYAHDLGLRLAWEAMERGDRKISDIDISTVVERLLSDNEGSFGDLYDHRVLQDPTTTMQLRQTTCEAIALTGKRSVDVGEIVEAARRIAIRWWGNADSIKVGSVRTELTKLLEPRETYTEILLREGPKGAYRYRYRNMMFRTFVRWKYDKRARGIPLR